MPRFILALSLLLALSMTACGRDGRPFPTQPPYGWKICEKPDTLGVFYDEAGVPHYLWTQRCRVV